MPLTGAYTMSKHAVLALCETLYHELKARNAPVGVSALCPEAIATGIGHSERVRPPHLHRKSGEADGPEFALVENAIRDDDREGHPAGADRRARRRRDPRGPLLRAARGGCVARACQCGTTSACGATPRWRSPF